jgi:AAA+ ATPase superfamily predicted ATPase
MFIDREIELKQIENHFRSNKAELLIIYGRRRVGKTALLKEFTKGKNNIYFLADLNPDNFQIDRFSEMIYDYSKDPLLKTQKLTSWEAVFEYLSNLTRRRRIAVIIDEFPFLISVNKALPSILQRYWDEKFVSSKIMLILCGSYISIMEQEVLGYKSPLYGRRTGQIMLQPFDFFGFANFFKKLDIRKLVEYYSISGGIPAYINQFEGGNIWREICQRILQTDSFLYNEVPFLLSEELREPRNYFAILQAIAFGKTKLNDISQITKIESSKLIRYLDILRDLRIVKREVPSTETSPHKSKKGLYRISDNFTKFWFRFVYPNKGYIESGDLDFVVHNKIKPFFDSFVGETFESVCIDFLKKGKRYTRIGRWWEKNIEIDIVGIDENNYYTFGECKWSKKLIGTDILNELLHKVEFFKKIHNVKSYNIMFFSKSGYTKEFVKNARKMKINLISLPEMQELLFQFRS